MFGASSWASGAFSSSQHSQHFNSIGTDTLFYTQTASEFKAAESDGDNIFLANAHISAVTRG